MVGLSMFSDVRMTWKPKVVEVSWHFSRPGLLMVVWTGCFNGSKTALDVCGLKEAWQIMRPGKWRHIGSMFPSTWPWGWDVCISKSTQCQAVCVKKRAQVKVLLRRRTLLIDWLFSGSVWACSSHDQACSSQLGSSCSGDSWLPRRVATLETVFGVVTCDDPFSAWVSHEATAEPSSGRRWDSMLSSCQMRISRPGSRGAAVNLDLWRISWC